MILKNPFVTEKASMMLENESKIQFLVQPGATKEQIKRDIEKSFGQKVTKIRTIMTTKNEKKWTKKNKGLTINRR